MQGRNYYPVLLTTSVEKKWLYFTVTPKRIRVYLYPVVFWVSFFFFCTDDVLLLLQGYNNQKRWSHSNVFRIHSRDRTPATSVPGKRPEDQIRCCCWQALPGDNLRLRWFSEGPHVCWTPVTDHICLLAISKHGEKPDGANPDESCLIFSVKAIN